MGGLDRVPRHTFSAVLGAVTAAGRNNAETFQVLGPGFDLALERQRREDPDARPALAALREMGLWVGAAGNQTARAATLIRALGLPVDLVATSGEWGVAKPDPGFFARILDAAGVSDSGEVVYVGDHRDHDLVPAKAARLRTVHVRRGPWGHLWADDARLHAVADWQVAALTEIPALLASAEPGRPE